MRPQIVLIILCILAASGCRQESTSDASVRLTTDLNGFVLNLDKQAPRLTVGVGESGEQLIRDNPYLRKVVWLPKTGDGNVFNEMRFALETTTDLYYNDSDIRLRVCAHRVSIDGNASFKRGVAFVGIKLCEAPINNYKRALHLAKEAIQQLERENPTIRNLREFYRTTPQQELTALGGNSWEGIAITHFKTMPTNRDNRDRDYLFTFEEADSHFTNKLSNPQYTKDVWNQPRLQGGGALLAVYAGKYAIFELSVHSDAHWGGQNLTKEKLDEQRYNVTMHFRLRSDLEPNMFPKGTDGSQVAPSK